MSLPCSDEDFRRIGTDSTSIADVLRTLGRAYVGTNYRLVRLGIDRLGLDTTHWQRPPAVSRILNDVLTRSSTYPRGRLKRRLLADIKAKAEAAKQAQAEKERREDEARKKRQEEEERKRLKELAAKYPGAVTP